MPTPGLDLAFPTVDDNKVTADLERIKAWSLLIQTAIDDVVTGAVPTGPAGGELSGTYPNPTIANGVIDNANVSNTAAIAYSKLALTLGIVNGDISASAAIAYSKLNLSGSIVNADVNASAAISESKLDSNVARRNADNTITGSVIASKATTTPNPVVSGTTSSTGTGVEGTSATGVGVSGAASGASGAVQAINSGAGAGVVAVGQSGPGVDCAADTGPGLQAGATSGPAIKVASSHGTGAAIDVNAQGKIIGLVDPTLAQDAATKTYVDTAVAAGVTFGTPGTILPDDAANAGTGTTAARANHTHAIAAATASSITGTNAEGSSSSFARADHNHAIDFPGAHITNTTTQSLNNGSTTTITFDTEQFDNGGCHSTSSNTSRLTAPSAGIYICTWTGRLSATTSARRLAFINLNGTSARIAEGDFDLTGDAFSVSGIYQLAANDYIEANLFVNIAGLTTVAAVCRFSFQRLR